MSYPIHFRKKILAKLEEGQSIRAVAQHFEIDKNTIVEWKKRIEIKRTRPRKPSKVDDDALRADVEQYPDDYQYERAARFGCCTSTIGDALKRLNITVKKRPYGTFYICCLLTGARKDEFLSLTWEDLDFRWKTIHLKDKVEDNGRIIPMTKYVEKLLRDLKKTSDSSYIFSSNTSATGYIVNPYKEFKKICNEIDIQLTIHGLRRSFKSLAEWVDIPVGVTAQISGHKPSALAEKHYTVRPMDMLRGHLQKYENWVLEQAKISF